MSTSSYESHLETLVEGDEHSQLNFNTKPGWFHSSQREAAFTGAHLETGTEGTAAGAPAPEKPQFFDTPTKPEVSPELSNTRITRNYAFCGLLLLMMVACINGAILYALYQDSQYLKETVKREVERTDDILQVTQVLLHDLNDLWGSKFRPQSLETLDAVSQTTTLVSTVMQTFSDRNATALVTQFLDSAAAFDQKLEALRQLMGGTA